MRINTIIPTAIALVILHACAGCTGSLDLTTEGKKLHLDFKPQAQSADRGGDSKPSKG